MSRVHILTFSLPDLCSFPGIALFSSLPVCVCYFPPFSYNSSPVWKLDGIWAGRKLQRHLCPDKSFWWKWKWFLCVTASPLKETSRITEMIVSNNRLVFLLFFSFFFLPLRLSNSGFRKRQLLITKIKKTLLIIVVLT